MKKLGIFSWYSYGAPIEERLRAIKRVGFDATMLWWDGQDRQTQPDLARKLGLEVENIHAPFKNTDSLWADSDDGQDFLDMLLSCVEDCARHSIPTAMIHITGY